MNLDEAIQQALLSNAILFCGAGFSLGATNLLGQHLKTGVQLAEHLAKSVGLPGHTPLEEASEEYQLTFGVDKLITELKNEFSVKVASREQAVVACLPWRRAYTTNYDDVLEVALSVSGRPSSSPTAADAMRQQARGPLICVHFNGYVGHLTRDALGSAFKLTDTSYVTTSVANSPWAHLFRDDLRSARAVFFVGYSLSDMDIRRILFETGDLGNKCFFILGPDPDPVVSRRASRYGTAVTIGTVEFAARIQAAQAVFSPPEMVEPAFYCLEKLILPASSTTPTDRAVFSLLQLGRMDYGRMWHTLGGGRRYFVRRTAEDDLLRKISSAEPVVVHSELANGKTLVIEAAKLRALESGYSVFTVVRRTDSLEYEIEQALQTNDRVLLVVEEYPDWLDAVRAFASHSTDRDSLIVSARSSANDVNIDHLCSILGRKSVSELCVDRLTDPDLAEVVAYFDEYGLWGEDASRSAYWKEGYLSTRCHREFSAILVHLFGAPQVAERYRTILTQLNSQSNYFDVVILILVLAVLQYRSTVDTLVDIYGDKVLGSKFQHDPVVRQILDFRHGEVLLRSAAAARFVLKQLENPQLAIDVLISAATAADRYRSISRTYGSLLTSLMRFSNVQQLVPEQGKLGPILRYYETIKNLDGARTNPLFWLQYAIACLQWKAYDRSEKYFETAYSFARKRNWETYQIDNHYARFLLLSTTETGNAANCMAAFRKAHQILARQISEPGRYYYPYRVANSYMDFYRRFANDMTHRDLQELAAAAAYVARRIECLPAAVQEHPYVDSCLKSMRQISTLVTGSL